MIYIDTNVIIAYMDINEDLHEEAQKLFRSIKRERKITSTLTLLELTSVYARSMIEKPLAMALYSLEKTKTNVMTVDWDAVYNTAILIAEKLKLKTLDLIHLAACKELKAKYFATLDKGILSRKEETKKLGIEAITAL
ncbi:MAG: type II toxin-antitoxin system VapC family toxin [Candidatus Njordarchaeia archaeon]